MKLQISFDSMDLSQALKIAKKVDEYADVLEVGSLLISKYGIDAVKKFKKEFPEKPILADLKIVDRGREYVELASQAGANWLSVMAGTSKNVIHSVCSAANKNKQNVMLDLIDSPSLGQSALEAESLGVDALLFHGAFDEEDPLQFLENWDMVKGNTTLPIFVSAQATRENIEQVLYFHPDGLIVGKAIVEAANPKEEAKFFYNLIKG